MTRKNKGLRDCECKKFHPNLHIVPCLKASKLAWIAECQFLQANFREIWRALRIVTRHRGWDSQLSNRSFWAVKAVLNPTRAAEDKKRIKNRRGKSVKKGSA